MGVFSRSIQQGIEVGKNPAFAMKGGVDESKVKPVDFKPSEVDDSVANADKAIDQMKSQKLELQDHHYPDASHGDIVQGKMDIAKDGTRSLDTSFGNDDARDKLISDIGSSGNMTLGGD